MHFYLKYNIWTYFIHEQLLTGMYILHIYNQIWIVIMVKVLSDLHQIMKATVWYYDSFTCLQANQVPRDWSTISFNKLKLSLKTSICIYSTITQLFIKNISQTNASIDITSHLWSINPRQKLSGLTSHRVGQPRHRIIMEILPNIRSFFATSKKWRDQYGESSP